MKKPLWQILAICLMLAGAAFAQSWRQQAKIDVPFDFILGDAVLPAGTYSVSTQAGIGTKLLMFTNTQTGAVSMVQNIDISPKSKMRSGNSNLVFVLDAQGHYVLHQLWLPDDEHGHDLAHKTNVPEPQ